MPRWGRLLSYSRRKGLGNGSIMIVVFFSFDKENVNTIYHYQWLRKVPKSGGPHRHVIYVPSVKNQYKRVVFGYMVMY